MKSRSKIIMALIIVISVLLVTALIVGGLLWFRSHTKLMEMAQVQQLALDAAGINATEAANLRCQLEMEETGPVYEVEFRVGSTEYEYVIDARDGTILQEESKQATGAGGQTVTQNLTAEQIEKIVLDHAKLKKDDVTRLSIQPDNESGLPCYEVEFVSGGTEYEYEINAITGDILSFKSEKD